MKMICESITTEKKFCLYVGCLILFLPVLIDSFLTIVSETVAAETSRDFEYQLINGGTDVEITRYHTKETHYENT